MPVTKSATAPGGRFASYVDRIVRGEKLSAAGSREVGLLRLLTPRARRPLHSRGPRGLVRRVGVAFSQFFHPHGRAGAMPTRRLRGQNRLPKRCEWPPLQQAILPTLRRIPSNGSRLVRLSHSRAEARSAPARRVLSLAHTTSSVTHSHPTNVPKPQSTPATTRSRSPTAATTASMRCATTSSR